MKQAKMKRKIYIKTHKHLMDVLSQVGTVSEDLEPGHTLFETYRFASDALDQFETYGIEMGYLDQKGKVIK